MRTTFKATLTAILLTGVAAAPLATAFTVLGADAAYAKSDKAKGGGGKSGERGNKGKSGNKGGKSGKSGSSKGGGKSARSGDDPIGAFVNKLTGRDKKAQRAAASGTASAKAKPAKGSGMHPSELGNMNGALNSNINATLAHIRNGNTNGPVGAMALLAVAKSNADAADELLSTPSAQEYAALEEAVNSSEEWDSIEDYIKARNDAEEAGEEFTRDEGIEAALANLGQSDLDEALTANTKYDSASAYLFAKEEAAATNQEFVVDEDLEAAIAKLNVYDPDEAAQYEDAEGAYEAQADAEANLLNLWNKNPGEVEVAEGETTPQDELLELAYQKLEGHEDEIAAAIDETGTADADEGTDSDDDELVDDECEEEEGCTTDEDMAAATE